MFKSRSKSVGNPTSVADTNLIGNKLVEIANAPEGDTDNETPAEPPIRKNRVLRLSFQRKKTKASSNEPIQDPSANPDADNDDSGKASRRNSKGIGSLFRRRTTGERKSTHRSMSSVENDDELSATHPDELSPQITSNNESEQKALLKVNQLEAELSERTFELANSILLVQKLTAEKDDLSNLLHWSKDTQTNIEDIGKKRIQLNVVLCCLMELLIVIQAQ